MKAIVLVLMSAALLAGCSGQPRHAESVTDRATRAACRARADAVYDRLNRADIYTIPQNGTPFSSSGLVGDPNAGLQRLYGHERMIDRCVHTTGAGTMTVGPIPKAAAVPPPPARH